MSERTVLVKATEGGELRRHVDGYFRVAVTEGELRRALKEVEEPQFRPGERVVGQGRDSIQGEAVVLKRHVYLSAEWATSYANRVPVASLVTGQINYVEPERLRHVCNT